MTLVFIIEMMSYDRTTMLLPTGNGDGTTVNTMLVTIVTLQR